MLKSRLIYALSVAASIAFMFFHNRPVAYITLIAVAILPLLSFGIFLCYRKKLTIKIMHMESCVPKETKLEVNVFVTNKSNFPVPCYVIKGESAFLTYDVKDKIILKGFAGSKGTSAILYQIYPLCRGLLQFSLKEIKIYDYLGLFSHKEKISIQKTAVITPKISNLSIAPEHHMLFGESDEFSPDVVGDDISEVFRLREYVQGDRIKTIHWKISSRNNTLLVRDFSKPIINNIVIAIDFQNHQHDKMENIANGDKVVEIALGIAASLMKNDVKSTIIWYSHSNKDLISLNVNSPIDFEGALSTLSSEKLFDEGISFCDMLEIFTSENENNNKIYCVVPHLDTKLQAALVELVSSGKADIGVYYIMNSQKDEKINNNIKSLKSVAIPVKEYSTIDINIAYERTLGVAKKTISHKNRKTANVKEAKKNGK